MKSTTPAKPVQVHPHEPTCFTTCDGPHSGVPSNRRPPHRDDAAAWFSRPVPNTLLEIEAKQWANYGFTAADVSAWQEAGIREASAAAECRTVGLDPSCEVDRRFLLSDDPETGRPFCDLLCDSDMTAEQAWRAWKAAP